MMKNTARICSWTMTISTKRSTAPTGGRTPNHCGLTPKIRFNWPNCSVGDRSVDDRTVGDRSVDDRSVDDRSVGDRSVRNRSVDDRKTG